MTEQAIPLNPINTPSLPTGEQTVVNEKRTAYVSIETEADRVKRKNLYFVSAFIGFVWMLFHFTVVFFFTLQLQSPLLVWVFLWLWNLVALMVDIPVGILIRYFSSKKLYFYATASMFVAGIIFLKFIYATDVFSTSWWWITSLLTNFLDSISNLFLLLLAACMYGITKEINDITTLSYILNNSDPSEYSTIISRNNIYVGWGSLLGLLASGTVLAFSPTVAVIILNLFIILLAVFIGTYFDNDEKTLTIADVSKLKVIAQKPNVEKLKEYAIGYMAKTDFWALAREAKLIFLKPLSRESNFDHKIIVPETKKAFFSLRKVLFLFPQHYGLLWFMTMILAFGFWDTFAAAFLIDFLAKLSTGPTYAYALLWIIAIPAFVTQDFFIKISKRIGTFPVIVFGLILSGISIGLLSLSNHVIFVLVCWIINSLGYAAGMGVSQGEFLIFYNNEFAKKEQLDQIDCNASASPMKIVQNSANVLGLTLGWALLAIFGFTGFFIVFGLLLLSLAVGSIAKRKMIEV